MARLFALLALLTLVSSSTVLTLPVTKRVNGSKLGNLANHDRARLQGLLHGAAQRVKSVSSNNTGFTYTVDVAVGSPATTYSLIVDTGSSNTWLGAGKAYVPTNASTPLHQNVSVTYGSGYFDGAEFLDRVELAPQVFASQQSIGVAEHTRGFAGFDGILGLGPASLTAFTVDDTSTVPTIVDTLYKEKRITRPVLGISFSPLGDNKGSGSLSFGAPDPTKYLGLVFYAPVTKTEPSKLYWGVDASISYGTSTLLGFTRDTPAAGFVDTGTTLILLATDAFITYTQSAHATMDDATGLLRLTKEHYAALQPMEFTIGGVTWILTPNAQILPRQLNEEVGGEKDGIYLIVANLGQESGQGLDFVLGQGFLERFYSVYDSGTKADGSDARVGLAYTLHTFSTSN